MEYNKNDFQKMNDKKVLHKVRKHWVVVSLAMLMALGGTAAATHVSANADATTSNSNAQSNTQTPKENQGQSLVKSANNNNASAQNNNQAQLNNKQNASQNITSQASQLHQRILSNVMGNQKPANSQLGAQQNGQQSAPKVSNHVNAPKVGANQSANGRGLLGERINNSLNDAAANKVSTNVNRRKLALTNPKAGMNLGDSATGSTGNGNLNYQPANPAAATSTMIIHYLATNEQNRQISEVSTSSPTDNTKTFDMTHYLNDLPQGDVLDTSKSGYDAKSDYPQDYIGGQHDLTVYVMPQPVAGQGHIRFNYVDASDGNMVENDYTSVNDPTSEDPSNIMTPSDVNGYMHNVPAGFEIADPNNVTVDGVSKSVSNLSIPYLSNHITNVNISISRIKDPNANMAQGTITYEDATDGDNVVDSVPFKESAGQPTNLSENQFDELLPSGYEKSSKPAITDSTWENGDNDIIFVQPDGTNPNVPKAQPGYSFVTVNYIDGNGKLINQFNVTGKDNTSFDLNNYKTAVPANYQLQSVNPNNVTNFPSKDGQDTTVTMNVSLQSDANPSSANYKPNVVQAAKYCSPKIQYVDVKTQSDVGDPITLTNIATGSVMNYTPYITNVPHGYNFVNMGNHETNASNANMTNIILVKKVNVSAMPITVNYFNQNGRKVGNATISNLPLTTEVNVTDPNGKSNVPSGYKVMSGQNVEYQVSNNDQTANIEVIGQPASQNGQPVTTTVKKTTTNSDGSTTTKSDTIDGITIKMNRMLSDGQGHISSDEYSDVIPNPVAGQEVTINPYDIAPAGYSTDPSQSPVTYQIQANGGTQAIDPSTGKAIDNAPSQYNYKLISTVNDRNGQPQTPTVSDGKGGKKVNPNYPFPPKTVTKNGKQVPNPNYPYAALVQPINVQFVNQKGNVVPDKDGQNLETLTGSYGKSIDVVDPSGKNEMPTGYHLNGDQNVMRTFTDDAQNVNVLIAGDSISSNPSKKATNSSTTSNPGSKNSNNKVPQNLQPGTKVTNPDGSPAQAGQTLKNNQVLIKQILNSQEGTQTNYQIVDINGDVGDSYTIAPNETEGVNLIPSDYSSSNKNQNYTATINADGTLSIPGVSNNTVTYNYDKNSSTINVEYLDGNSGSDVENTTATGELGTQLNWDYYNNNLPTGYVLDGGALNADNFGGTQRVDDNNAPVFSKANEGKALKISVQKASTIQIQYYNVTANQHTALGAPKTVTGTSNQSYTVQPSDTELVPAGYSFDGVIEGATKGADGKYSMPFGQNAHTIGIDVTKNQSSSNTSSSNVGTVNIHYMNSTNTNDINPNDQIDEMTVSNDLNSKGSHTFDPKTYEENGPYGYSVISNGNLPANATNFTPGTNDYYVYVQRNNKPMNSSTTAKIEYVDENTNTPVMTINDTGTTGKSIDLSKYEGIAPSGYQYVGLGHVDNTFNGDPNGEVEQILVNKPAPSYGTITIRYIDNTPDKNGHVNPSVMNSDTIVANGKSGSSFDMSTYENSVPVGYSYMSAGVNDPKTGKDNPNGFIDYYNGGSNQTLDINVQKTPKQHNYSTITAIYKDVNGSMPAIHVKESGRIGDVFDASQFEHSCPEGATFKGVDPSSSVPSFFPQWNDKSKANTTITFDVIY